MKEEEKKIYEALNPTVESLGYELSEVRLSGGKNKTLSVVVDRVAPISLEDIVAVSEEINKVLDELDPITGSYTFEVSSAGAERQLKRPSDFERFIGHLVEVKLYHAVDGRKSYVGDLAAYDDGAVEITVPGGDSMRFEKSDVAGVRLRIA